MDDILSRIVKDKRAEVEENKIKHPLASFADRIAKSDRDFKEAIRKQEKINLIAELKFSSPAKNQKIIPTKKQIEQIAQLYNKYAKAISVITDEKYFGGSPEYLKIVRKNTDVPVLRKDFIIDKYQVYESRLVGADAILLIASVL
ncbi:MAG: bifunctional indole-3-glycerol phosphate synthase/phosphoribosylanthranilate isomerase, partial [Candidatus Aenigmarchaeota archaeon]|nr:bifunctional indole-3-glycerol phosphate synthase/phosphoribosylanthranilate isomerase [Candidatus Aenigmarchaeota archaeon]